MNIRKIHGVLTLVSVEVSDLKDGTVLIPASVRAIGRDAFRDYTGLTSITLPAGVTSIGMFAFANCSSLTSITLPAGFTSIEWRAFSNCSSLTSITLPAGVRSIGGYAFAGCTGLTSIMLPAGVISIETNAFSGCTGLTSITLPAGITSIAGWAFARCTSLTSITLPAGVRSIEAWAFAGCTGLTSIMLPAGVISIGTSAFSGCTGLTSITLPAGITSIEAWVFDDCTSLTSITLPPSVVSIGLRAFFGCTSLTSITLPSGVTEISWETFDCPNLTHILINTDKLEELERIKQLLPGDVKEKVAINPMLFEAKQLQRELLVDFSVTIHAKIYSVTNRSSSVVLPNDMVKKIFSYDALDTAPVLSLKEAFEKEPVPDSTDSFAAYKATLVAIERFYIQCEPLIPRLQQYNKIIQETVPPQYWDVFSKSQKPSCPNNTAISSIYNLVNSVKKYIISNSGFFSSNRMPSNANNVAMLNTYKLVERLIDSLKKHTIPCLSAEEQETLFSKPALLTQIPLDVRKKMGMDLPPESQALPSTHSLI